MIPIQPAATPLERPPAETLPILFQDDHLIAVHKPAGLLVHRTNLDRHERRFALQIVRDQIGRTVHAVHRLDKGTSGVLLFGKSPEMGRLLGALFELQQVDKTYLAVVRGHPPEEGVIDHALTRIADDYEGGRQRLADAPQAALTTYRRLASWELPHRVDRYPTSRYALVQLQPLTGRRHQLRRHLKHISHPIIGDATYGKGRHNRLFTELFGCSRLVLACMALRFEHPVTGAEVAISAPLAADFARLLEALGGLPGHEATSGINLG